VCFLEFLWFFVLSIAGFYLFIGSLILASSILEHVCGGFRLARSVANSLVRLPFWLVGKLLGLLFPALANRWANSAWRVLLKDINAI